MTYFPSGSGLKLQLTLNFLSATQNIYEFLGTQDLISVIATDIYSLLPNLTTTKSFKEPAFRLPWWSGD